MLSTKNPVSAVRTPSINKYTKWWGLFIPNTLLIPDPIFEVIFSNPSMIFYLWFFSFSLVSSRFEVFSWDLSPFFGPGTYATSS